MKHLFTTTALATMIALPVAAQDTMSETETSGYEQMQQMEIKVSNLLDRQIYMPHSDSAGATSDSDVAGDGTDMPTDTASNTATDGEAIDTSPQDTTVAGHMGAVSDVQNNWQMVGEVEDVLLSREGEAQGLIVDAGGFLGMGETEKQISMNQIRFVEDSDDEGEFYLVYAGDRSTFDQSENFDEARAEQEGWRRASETEAAQMWEEERTSQTQGVELSQLTTDDLLGAAAYGSNEEWVGEVSELSLSDDGKMEAIILDVGGFLGIGEKAVAMQPDQVEIVRVGGDDLRAYVNATEEQLESMQTWNES
ncbi:PRC-barrel domain-containing protein [Tritonibacter mobilis]|uniref:PRC-barrel domain-containing protein n=1 Tax=Tritonibacter mobilis TaxID=379347 RepID=UPI001447FB48|nr:PRC-barrel domain containing protein [Rhodobacteraceae bacterium R_SAG6]